MAMRWRCCCDAVVVFLKCLIDVAGLASREHEQEGPRLDLRPFSPGLGSLPQNARGLRAGSDIQTHDDLSVGSEDNLTLRRCVFGFQCQDAFVE